MLIDTDNYRIVIICILTHMLEFVSNILKR